MCQDRCSRSTQPEREIGGPFIVGEAALLKPQTGVESPHNEQELGYSPPQEATPHRGTTASASASRLSSSNNKGLHTR